MKYDIVVIGGGSPHILSISLPGYRSEVLMNFLEARGIYTSKSSACKKGGRSHVLEAIGLPANVIDGALRISFSRYTTREDIDAMRSELEQQQLLTEFTRSGTVVLHRDSVTSLNHPLNP